MSETIPLESGAEFVEALKDRIVIQVSVKLLDSGKYQAFVDFGHAPPEDHWFSILGQVAATIIDVAKSGGEARGIDMTEVLAALLKE